MAVFASDPGRFDFLIDPFFSPLILAWSFPRFFNSMHLKDSVRPAYVPLTFQPDPAPQFETKAARGIY
jgi:hypothetical protein